MISSRIKKSRSLFGQQQANQIFFWLNEISACFVFLPKDVLRIFARLYSMLPDMTDTEFFNFKIQQQHHLPNEKCVSSFVPRLVIEFATCLDPEKMQEMAASMSMNHVNYCINEGWLIIAYKELHGKNNFHTLASIFNAYHPGFHACYTDVSEAGNGGYARKRYYALCLDANFFLKQISIARFAGYQAANRNDEKEKKLYQKSMWRQRYENPLSGIRSVKEHLHKISANSFIISYCPLDPLEITIRKKKKACWKIINLNVEKAIQDWNDDRHDRPRKKLLVSGQSSPCLFYHHAGSMQIYAESELELLCARVFGKYAFKDCVTTDNKVIVKFGPMNSDAYYMLQMELKDLLSKDGFEIKRIENRDASSTNVNKYFDVYFFFPEVSLKLFKDGIQKLKTKNKEFKRA